MATHAEGGITPSRQVLRRSKMVTNWVGWGGVVDTAGGAATHLPSKHSESTQTHTIRFRKHGKWTNVCQVTFFFATCLYLNLEIGFRRSRRQKISALNSSLRNMIYIERRCFSPFPPCFPVGMLPVIQLLCNVWTHLLFYLMVPGISDKAFRGCFTTLDIYRTEGNLFFFFFSYVIAHTREIQSQEDDG